MLDLSMKFSIALTILATLGVGGDLSTDSSKCYQDKNNGPAR